MYDVGLQPLMQLRDFFCSASMEQASEVINLSGQHEFLPALAQNLLQCTHELELAGSGFT